MEVVLFLVRHDTPAIAREGLRPVLVAAVEAVPGVLRREGL